MAVGLLVIDVQRGLSTGEWAAYDIARVIETINGLIARARGAGAPVFFVQHEEGPDGCLVPGSEWWELDERLNLEAADPRVRKAKASSFQDTDLHPRLQELGVSRLVLCGMQTDECLDATARGALALGYRVEVAADAHTTVDSGGATAAEIIERQNDALRGLEHQGAAVTVQPAEKMTFAA